MGDVDVDPCPICLEPLPTLTWRGNEKMRTLCCGKFVCTGCFGKMNNAQRDLAARVDALSLNGLETQQNPVQLLQEIEQQHNIHNKCPVCRELLPVTAKERFNLVKKTLAKHPEWVWVQYKLGMYYKDGIGVTKSPKQAFKLIKKAAEKGNVMAIHEMGNCYQNGLFVGIDYREASKWYRIGVDKGFALSQNQLGRILRDGVGGVSKDEERGFCLLKAAAEQGVHAAQCDLAYSYENGIGVRPASLELSLKWNLASAEQGNVVAMMNYAGNLLAFAAQKHRGDILVAGQSPVPKALYWARKAVTAGERDAISLVSQLETGISNACGNCKAPPKGEQLKMCARCKAISYCSSACQKKHWAAGHRKDCVDAKV